MNTNTMEGTKDTLSEEPAEKIRKEKRNNSIELLRFLFTAIIIFFHVNLDLWDQDKVIAVIRGVPVTFFMHGNLGVEFFFLVTGYLLARSVHKKIQEDKERPGTAARSRAHRRAPKGVSATPIARRRAV